MIIGYECNFSNSRHKSGVFCSTKKKSTCTTLLLVREFLQGNEVRTGILKQLRQQSSISKQSHYDYAYLYAEI